MLNKRSLCISLLLTLLAACVTTPVSDKSAFILVPFGQEVSLGKQSYQDILKDSSESKDTHLNEVIQRMGKRIAAVSAMPNLEWEFRLIESEDKNAFALPGGKVAVYTGILPAAQNEAGLATVMSHEIAHVIARHGAQRMTQQLLVTVGMTAAGLSMTNDRDKQLIMGALGLGVMVGVTLPFSRSNEAEADQIGLVYMAKAGYDPNEAIKFWQRFSEDKGNTKTLELMSTHPADATRIQKLRQYLPRALSEYKRAKEKYGLGESFESTPKDQKEQEGTPAPPKAIPGVSVETLTGS